MPNLGYMSVQFIHLLALSLWIGGTAAISMLVTPTLFRSLPTKATADRLVGETLRKFDRVKDACCLALAAASILKFTNWERNWNVWFATRYLAILVMILTALVADRMISPAIRILPPAARAEGDLQDSRSSPSRAFRRASAFLRQVGLFAALVALVLS